jgi:hypothetical protein
MPFKLNEKETLLDTKIVDSKLSQITMIDIRAQNPELDIEQGPRAHLLCPNENSSTELWCC